MENYNENSKENVSILSNLVTQSIIKPTKNKFNNNLWLKDIYTQVIHIFGIINKNFINGNNSDEKSGTFTQKQVTENCLLYGDQILKCLKQLKNIFAYESKYNITLKTSTQFLADRLLLCLEKINSLAALSTNNSRNIDKLLDNLDSIFSFMKLLQTNGRDGSLNELDKFNKTIADLISQSWEFACFLDDADNLVIKKICNNMFTNHKALMDDFNKSTESDKEAGLMGSAKFNLDLLYNAVLSLEVNLNDCFLRLIYTTFSYLETRPLNAIMKVKAQAEIDRFDLANERLFQIAVYAAYYTNDLKIKSKILSGLETMESLDTYLIPTIMSDSDEFCNLLKKMWESTAKSLQYHIHSVIDTVPFLHGIGSILMKVLELPRQTICSDQVESIIFKLKIISNHFYINIYDFEDGEIKQHIDNFKLMVRELEAINECFEKVDRMKIIKRIKIVKSILKKMSAAIEVCRNDDVDSSLLENTNTVSNAEVGRIMANTKHLDTTFVKKTDHSVFDIEISNILNEFLMLSNEFSVN